MSPHLLLVSPAFHGYWDPIRRAFERTGHRVSVCVYDALPGRRDKLRNKLGHELPARLGVTQARQLLAVRHTEIVRQALADSSIDAVLVIKGDSVPPGLWQEVRRNGRPVALWLYDELRRTSYQPEDMQAFTGVATYSPLDAADFEARGLNAVVVPLAFDEAYSPSPRMGSEIVFVGARYPSRERLLGRVHAKGLPVRCYGRQWSHHPVDRARTMQWQRPAIPAGRDLSRLASYDLMAGSAAALNLHSDQDGFTMRTFEASGAGALQIIDRKDVEQHYDPGVEVAAFSTEEEMLALCERALGDRHWRRALGRAARRRTLQQHTFTHRAREIAKLWA